MQLRYSSLILAVLILGSSEARSQNAPCLNAGTLDLDNIDSEGYPIPNGFTSFRVVTKNGDQFVTQESAYSQSGQTQPWKPTQEQRTRLAQLAAGTDAGRLHLQWFTPANENTSCTMGIVISRERNQPEVPTPTPTTTTTTTGTTLSLGENAIRDMALPTERIHWATEECKIAGNHWASQLERRRQENQTSHQTQHPLTVIMFRENEGVCYRNRDYGVQGDPIYVGVFTENVQQWNGVSITFEPCSLQPAAPAIYESGRPSGITNQRQSGTYPYRVITYPEQSCWDESLAITVLKRAIGGDNTPPTGAARYTLRQYRRYRAGLLLGVGFSDLHDVRYGIRTDVDPDVIYEKGVANNGPEYTATVVLYSILRYLPSLAGQPAYQGRDLVNDHAFADRIGLQFGVGLRDPFDRFVVGAAFELLPGVNVTANREFAKIQSLTSGLRVGDPFSGGEELIPRKDEWESTWTFGISIDVLYANALFNR